jgi:peptide/nickel transport system substrate-binding protein
MRRNPILPSLRWVGPLVVGALLLTAATSLSADAKTTAKTSSTVTWAELPSAPPEYISPLAGSAWFSVTNLSDFSEIMYRPLFWFGDNGQPKFNAALSIANAPVWSDNDQTATITMKHWVWSNGAPITARDVVFWMNLLEASVSPAAANVGSSSAPGPGYGAFVSGGFPNNVVSYTATGTYSLTFHLNASYDPTWYLYNELSQITPLPQASWDKLSATGAVGNYDEQGIGTGTTGALGVAQYINLQSEDTSTYATNPMWQVVSGPYKLSQYTTAGFVKMVPNTKYSGPDKAKVGVFEEIPFTSDTAEFNELRAGDLTIGYIPAQDLGQKSYMASHGYTFAPWNSFGIVYFPYNFTDPTTGPIFKQLYFRQAFQSLVNQPEYIKKFLAGYGTIGNGPVPTFPTGNADLTKLESSGQVYPYDPSKAVALLKDHGWSVKPGGTTTCTKPGSGTGECGAGIAAGASLSFRLLYASGSVPLTDEMEALKSTEDQEAGIQIALSQAPFGQVIATTFGGGCSTTSPCSTWDMGNWGGGWVYSPDYFPTGEELFETGAESNPGYYSSAETNKLIAATNTDATVSGEIKALDAYENYLAKQLPVVWMPDEPYQLTMYKSKLKGLVPQGVFDEIYPEDYSF